jgi:hypothetical protein
MALMATHDGERRYVGSAVIGLNRAEFGYGFARRRGRCCHDKLSLGMGNFLA